MGIFPVPGGHKTWSVGDEVWLGSHLSAPISLYFLAFLYFFPCITVLVKIVSLGAQKHTK
jgi:hypothetical protein